MLKLNIKRWGKKKEKEKIQARKKVIEKRERRCLKKGFEIKLSGWGGETRLTPEKAGEINFS